MLENLLTSEHFWALMITAIGAFFGSLFGFIFGLMTERNKRIRERWEEHCINLVKLQVYLNEIMSIITSNRALASQVFNTLPKSPDDHPLLWNEPQILPRDISFVFASPRHDLLNDLFSLNEKIRKLNNDSERICRAYGEMRSAFLSRNLSSANYHRSIEDFRKNIGILVAGYNMVEVKVLDLLARVRVSLRKDNQILKKRLFWGRPKAIPLKQDEVETERKVIIRETEEVRARSRAEIEKFLGASEA